MTLTSKRRAVAVVSALALAFSMLALVPATQAAVPAGELLITEVAVTPTAGEFVEIHNPGGAAIDLSDVYLTDATFGIESVYYNIPTGADAGGGGFSDFHARFPDGATIGAGEYQTVAMDGAGFLATYSFAATYELFATDGTPDMREALPDSVNGQGGLSNDGEVVILYAWDGATDLVEDLDYALWGDKKEAIDKTGVSIDGPDLGGETTGYLPDTAIGSQDVVAGGGHSDGSSFQRFDFTEGEETQSDGNGLFGSDETSEDLSVTWFTGAASPGEEPSALPPPNLVINEIMQNPSAVSDTIGEWLEIYNAESSDVNLLGYTLLDDDFDSHVIASAVIVPAGGFAVLARNDDSATNGGVVADYKYADFLLGNSGDEVVLLDAFGSEVDRVEYDGGPQFPDPTGASMSLEDVTFDSNVGANWCAASVSTIYGDGDRGTPGAANVCDPPQTVAIHDVQGASHTSPLNSQAVIIADAVVTAVAGSGFYMQEPVPDADDATSEGIFVFTGSTPGVAEGDLVSVRANVTEAGSFGDLSTTQLNGLIVTVHSSGNSLPSATVAGNGGRIPPNTVIEDDAFGSFDVADDGIDYWESLEGMRVQVNNPIVIAGTNRFGELAIVGDNGANAGPYTHAGGLLVNSEADFNPEILIVDDGLIETPEVTTGDSFADPIVGVLSYTFGAFKLFLTEGPPATVPGGFARETTQAQADDELSVATFNVLNLDPGDPASKFTGLGEQVVVNLASPDIISLQEIQDNTGSTDNGVVAADLVYQGLIDAITAAGGPLYDFREIAPQDKQDGGQPGANIRVGFLFRPDRVTLVERGNAGPTIASKPVLGAAGVELTFSPGRINPTSAAYFESRKPLAAEFEFHGEKVFVVAAHFNSKSDDDALYGSFQPPAIPTETQRLAIAGEVNQWVDDILALDPNANVVVAGDLNEFEFRPALAVLEGGDGALTNLIGTVPADERYSFIFNGNSQVLDHILVSPSLVAVSVADYVHANIDHPVNDTDHDPVVARIQLDGSLQFQKGEVLDDLSALVPTGSKNDDRRINKAIGHLEDSLDPARWIGGSHLDAKNGDRVFKDEMNAVMELGKVKGSAKAAAQAAIGALVAIDESLAQIAIDMAIAGEGDPREIDRALEEMAKAAQELAKGKPDRAIDYYRKAWDRATKALKNLIELQVLGFNDYHGHLEANTPGDVAGSAAGGGEYLSTMLNMLRAGQEHSLTVAAGDLIGGSPAFSGLFHDEPSVESLNAMQLDVSSVGNHEFDEGVTELLRMQNGGCHPVDGCYFPEPYPGADFRWLAANTVSETTGETPLPPYWIAMVDNVKVGFIGMTLEATPTLVAAAGIVGWEFLDEAETANALVPILKNQGVEAMVVLLHEGGSQTPPPGVVDACVGISGPIVAIHDALDPEIDAMITGHTHLPYNCELTDPAGQPRIVTSAYSYGRVVTELNLVLDTKTKDVRRDLSTSTNYTVDQGSLSPDPVQTAIIEKWQPLVDAAGGFPVGTISADINRGGNPPTTNEDRGVESAAGNLVADAQLWWTSPNGAEIAFMNPGGVRSDLTFLQSQDPPEGDGVVTFGEAFTFQPFGNTLVTYAMTGAEIVSVLEEQCQPAGSSRPFLHLGVSDGVTYDLDKTIVDGDCTAVAVTNVRLDGEPLIPAESYNVTVNTFLADGGDNFDTLGTITTSRLDGGNDLQALINYLGTFSPVAPPSTDRVREL